MINLLHKKLIFICLSFSYALCWGIEAEILLKTEAKGHTIKLYHQTNLILAYIWDSTEKYPYFYPVSTPASGISVTARRVDPWPHHSSLFFGCDRVNGGNFWQDNIHQGQITPLITCMNQKKANQVHIFQQNRWNRLDAEAPFEDFRTIIIWVPNLNQLFIDFTIRLKALIKVRIERTNHSLFAARMAPELSVKGGGRLINAHGDEGEKATFGRQSSWMHAYGMRYDRIEGLAIFDHPANQWYPAPWFTRDYGFISPTPLNWIEKELELLPDSELALKYLVLVHYGHVDNNFLDTIFTKWINGTLIDEN